MRAEQRATLRAGIQSLPRPVWILCAGSFVNRFGSFVAVFLVLYLREKHSGRHGRAASTHRGPGSDPVAGR